MDRPGGTAVRRLTIAAGTITVQLVGRTLAKVKDKGIVIMTLFSVPHCGVGDIAV